MHAMQLQYASLSVVSGKDGNGAVAVVSERLTLISTETRRRHCGGPCTSQALLDRAFGNSQPQRDVVKDEETAIAGNR